jgi:hypothetical protein
MKLITLESSRKNERRPLSNAERWKEVERSKIGEDGQRFATSFEFWPYEFVLSAIMYFALNPFTAWFWAPFVYFLS